MQAKKKIKKRSTTKMISFGYTPKVLSLMGKKFD